MIDFEKKYLKLALEYKEKYDACKWHLFRERRKYFKMYLSGLELSLKHKIK